MKAKKIIVGILIFIAALIMLAALNTVHAEGLGYLKISKERTATEKFVIDPEKLQQLFPMSAMSQDLELMEAQAMGPEVASQAVTKEFKLKYKYQLYSQNGGQTKNIWKLVSCSNAQGTESTVQLKDLYCLRAGLGFMAEGNADSPDNVRNYTLQYDLPAEYEGIKKLFAGEEGSTEITIFKEENRDDLNAVLWILDHMLLEDASDEALNTYLKEYAGYSDEDLSKEPLKENVLTRSDIEAIQQLALWYFTNEEAGEAGYHNETLPTLFIDIDDEDGETYLYSTHEEEQDEEDSYKQFSDIFNNKGIQHGQYGTERQNKAEALYKKLIQQAQEEAKKVTEGLYKAQRDITVYFAGTNAKAEQPVVQVKEKKPYVDVALRKFITKINEKELRNEDGTFEREPKVDTSKLNDVVDGKVVKTADYNHTKQPVKVTVGDKVVYRLRIYNEGEVDTHITKVKDHLPEYLDCNDNEWTYDEHTHTATSKDECKIVGVGGKLTDSDGSKVGTTNLKDVLIPAAEKKSDAETDSEDDYTLSYVDIEIECTVNAKINNRESFGKKITNIAEIAEMTDRDNQPLKEDRDSVPDGKNNPNGGGEKVPLDNTTGEELEKYKDQEIENQKQEHDNNDEWNYIPGQEDDDDFEKLYVGSPDVALRKFITQIGDTPVTDRVPNVDSTKLNKGNTTTADYNHTKQPKRVEIGDKITYTLRVYNEGDIDVYITEITDHLPPELTYDEEENTQWELKDVNKAVSLAESCKVVNAGGKLVASEQKGKLLKEVLIPAAEYNEETGDYTLSYVDVEIVCTVLATAKPGQKITNIAEITKMENANHVVMEDDRDSKPDGNKDGNPVVEGAPAEDYKDPAIKDQKQKHDNGEDWNYIPG